MKTSSAGLQNRRGQILVVVLVLMAVLLVIVPTLVKWLQHNSKMSVKDRKATTAFNLAETAVDRGYWKAKSSTGTIAMALASTVITGYNFDTTYNDVTGGTYRVRISSANNKSITIVGEGRDSSTNEVRALSAVFQNRTIYSPLLAQGNINYSKGVSIFWGPIMSQGNITLDATTAQWYFPRKFARGNVLGTAANPRNTTWPLPPNTDNGEWWANYPNVPELPILDFASLRASAAASNTLNVYGCKNSTRYTTPATGLNVAGAATWDTRTACGTGAPHYSGTGGACFGSSCHFGDSWDHPKSPQNQPNTDYVWYWDGDVIFSSGAVTDSLQDIGLRGTIIVRGNMTIGSSGNYNYVSTSIPKNAWQEHQKLTTTVNDTTSQQEYPADIGLKQSTGTWNFGGNTFQFPTAPPALGAALYHNTVGIRGFTYVGGNLIIKSFMDFNGAIWVNGNVSATCPSGDPNCLSSFCGIFYDDNLQVPVLNVILVRTSWQEVKPSAQAWP